MSGSLIKKFIAVLIILWQFSLLYHGLLRNNYLEFSLSGFSLFGMLISLIGFVVYLVKPTIPFKIPWLILLGYIFLSTALYSLFFEKINWLNLAVEKHNIFFCNFTTPRQMSSDIIIADEKTAEESCKIRYAARVGDYEYCSQLPVGDGSVFSDKEGCWSLLVDLARNQSVCNHVPSKYADRCFQIVQKRSGDPSYCLSLAESNRDSCLMDMVMSSGNVSICSNILDVGRINQCISFAAENKHDPNICNHINVQYEYFGFTKQGCLDAARR